MARSGRSRAHLHHPTGAGRKSADPADDPARSFLSRPSADVERAPAAAARFANSERASPGARRENFHSGANRHETGSDHDPILARARYPHLAANARAEI